MKGLFVFFVLVALFVAVDAKKKRKGDHVLGGRTRITDDQVDEFIRLSPTSKEDKFYYSWTTIPNCLRWGTKGIDSGEMAYLTRPEGDSGQVAGAGVYMASKTDSSKSYGPCVVQFTIPAGTIIYKPEIARRAFGKDLGQGREKVELGRIVPFIHCDYSDLSTRNGWCVVHHDSLVKRTYEPNPVGEGIDLELERFFPTYKDLSVLLHTVLEGPEVQGLPGHKAEALKGAIGYFSSFSYLMFYIDGFSMIRGARLFPDNPWQVFEPENFENFKRTRVNYEKMLYVDKTPLGLSTDGRFGDGSSSKTAWARRVVEEILPKLYRDISGSDIKFRTNEVRAGDWNGPKKMFKTTSQQIVEMQSNPYLTVGGFSNGTGTDKEYFVYYYYPDAQRYASLAGKRAYLSEEMERKLKAGGDVAALTQELMADLLLRLFERVHGTSVDFTAGGLVAILDLVGIHPCSDFNGRTTRFFGQVASMESLRDPAGAFMSDFDLVTSRTLYGSFLEKSTKLYQNFRIAMLEQLIKNALWRGQKADGPSVYFGLPEFDDLLKSLEVFASVKPGLINTFRGEDWYMIEKRRFVDILDKLFGKNWKSRNSRTEPRLSETNGVIGSGGCGKKKRKYKKF